MARMDLSIDIAATPEVVWPLLSDLENAAERIQGIEKIEILTDGPVGVGTKWRETRVMMGKEATEEMTISEWVPNSHMTATSYSCGSDASWTMRVVPKGDGSTLRTDMEFKPRTFMAKLMQPIGWLMKGVMKKCVLKDMEDVKRAAEAAAAEANAGASTTTSA